MSRQKRKHAEKIIVDAIEKLYPDLKVRPTSGNYILNQLLKAGYTNDEISSTPEEVKDDLSKAAFACNTENIRPITGIRPAVHFTIPGEADISPCGDADEQSAVTNNDFEVTCDKCKQWLAKPANPKGR